MENTRNMIMILQMVRVWQKSAIDWVNGASNPLGQLFDGPLRLLLPWRHLICQLPTEGEATGLDQQEGHRQRRRVVLRVDDVLAPEVVGPALPLPGPSGTHVVGRGGVGEALVGLGGDLGEISKYAC